MVITIDGPAGSGKTTIARALARAMGFRHLDTGAMYRAVTVRAMEAGLDLDDETGIAALAVGTEVALIPTDGADRVVVDGGRDVTTEIRTPRIDRAVSVVATLALVRAELAKKQRAFAEGLDVVAEGRDMGTVVFPDAGLKVYLDAKPAERARRRIEERRARGASTEELTAVAMDQGRRDATDMGREVAPLRPAPGAVVVDSTDMTPQEVLERLVGLVRARRE